VGSGGGGIMLRSFAEARLGASNSTRVEGGEGIGKVEGPRAPFTSSRLMSSKCDRSLGPMTSERPEE
jgi:hypothetical protein